MDAVIEPLGEDVLCRATRSGVPEWRIAGEPADAILRSWATRYALAVKRDLQSDLLAIGSEMFRWLDENGWAHAWASAAGARVLEVRVDDPDTTLGRALLDAPWELLAEGDQFLADDAVQLFEVVRRIGQKDQPRPPRYCDLRVLFMAAAPEGEQELDFEAEESSIVEATEGLPMHLLVEESGSITFLANRLAEDLPMDGVHISCHGNIDPRRGPVIALEDETGALVLADAGELAQSLGDEHQKPTLVFVSACRTAESNEAGDRSTESFVRALTRAGIANVVGWNGSVSDADAAAYASAFYGELARGTRVARAAALARHRLRMTAKEDLRGRGGHWHLARLYLGCTGGGALIETGKPRRRLPGSQFEKQFLDEERKEVPIAKRTEFVGRRRPTQTVLRAFRASSGGVLLYGMANLGKSSLAARIASRMLTHRTVVIFHEYDCATVFDRLIEALPPEDRRRYVTEWRDSVYSDASCLADALESMLSGPLDEHPILLIIDDLERILEAPSPDDSGATPMKAQYRATYCAVLDAFDRSQTCSRLLLTSRYRFSLRNARGRELTQQLTCLQVPPMKPIEQRKHWSAKRLEADDARVEHIDKTLVVRVLSAAEGNPGLQSDLLTPLLNGESAVAGKALDAIEHFRTHGVPPDEIARLIDAGVAHEKDDAIVTFFRRMAFEKYRAALSGSQATLLAAASLCDASIPIPRPAVEAAGAAAGVEHHCAALDRLLGLGLVDDYGLLGDVAHVSANAFARPLAPRPDVETVAVMATAAVPPFLRSLRDPPGQFRASRRMTALCSLMLKSTTVDGGELGQVASAAALHFVTAHSAERARIEVLEPALARLDSMACRPPSTFAQVMFECAARLGLPQMKARAAELMEALNSTGMDRGTELLRLAEDLKHRDPQKAEAYYSEATAIFKTVGHEHAWATARGGIAGILQERGELDEALRIRTEEELPIYRKVGDLRAHAFSWIEISRIYQVRGRLDEAMHILQEQLLVFDGLRDVLSKASTQGAITRILEARGQFPEALRILVEEELPVYEQLDEPLLKAATQGHIADIYLQQGRFNEALRVRIEEELPVYERFGDLRAHTITRAKVADIHRLSGRADEALRILRDEVLPIFERLKDARSQAMALGGIADILQQRGQVDEALRIRLEQELPIFERLGDVRSAARTRSDIADIQFQRGHADDALQIWTEKLMPVFEKLGDVRSKAVTLGKIADVHAMRRRFDEALRIRTQEQLPLYAQVGDERAIAVTHGKIADIYQERGQLDEALGIRTEKELAGFTQLEDEHARSVTQSKIAEILIRRGDFRTREGQLRLLECLEDGLPAQIELGSPECVGRWALMLAKTMAVCGGGKDPLPVLQMSEEAFESAGNREGISDVKKMRALLDGAAAART